VAGLTNRDPGEQKHIITGRLVDWATMDGRALEGLATAGPGDERCPQRTPTADYRLCHGP